MKADCDVNSLSGPSKDGKVFCAYHCRECPDTPCAHTAENPGLCSSPAYGDDALAQALPPQAFKVRRKTG